MDGSNAGVAYDKNGNMLRVPTGDALTGPPRHLKWNAWNQLVEVRDHTNALIQRNAYDALFRRTTRELNDSTVIHCYYNDQWRPVEERIDSSTDPSAVYFWGSRYRDDLARRDRDTNANGTLDESLWCLMDYFDPIAVIDDEGEVVERYAFSAFGVASVFAPDYSVRTASAVAWDFLFHGQFEDAETRWQNYGYRFYVPELGRWINRDPIGEEGGANLYGFVGNNPTRAIDRFGLDVVTAPPTTMPAHHNPPLPKVKSCPSTGFGQPVLHPVVVGLQILLTPTTANAPLSYPWTKPDGGIDEDQKFRHRMRLQLQTGTENLWSDVYNASPCTGVTTTQLYVGLISLESVGGRSIPKQCDSHLSDAISKMQKQISGFPPNGILQGGNVARKGFECCNKRYRIDLENLYGYNLRF